MHARVPLLLEHHLRRRRLFHAVPCYPRAGAAARVAACVRRLQAADEADEAGGAGGGAAAAAAAAGARRGVPPPPRAVARNGQAFVTGRLTMGAVCDYYRALLAGYAKLQRFDPRETPDRY